MLYPSQSLAVKLFQYAQSLTMQEKNKLRHNFSTFSIAIEECDPQTFFESLTKIDTIPEKHIEFLKEIHSTIGIDKLSTVFRIFEQLLDGQFIYVEATFSRQPSQTMEQNVITYALNRNINAKHVLLDVKVDPSLLLGYNIKIGDDVTHYSINNSLKKFAEALEVA